MILFLLLLSYFFVYKTERIKSSNLVTKNVALFDNTESEAVFHVMRRYCSLIPTSGFYTRTLHGTKWQTEAG